MKNRFVIGYYNFANLITILGLACAILACFLLARGQYVVGMLAFSMAGLCDMMDGKIARASLTTSKRARFYGVQLDSLCDVVSFGVMPCLMAYFLGYNGTPDIILYILFMICGAIRLANFNTEAALDTADLKMHHFTGIPIPFSCLIFPLLMIVHILVGGPVYWLFRLIFLLVAFGYISRIRIPKPNAIVQFGIGIYEVICVVALLIITLVKK